MRREATKNNLANQNLELSPSKHSPLTALGVSSSSRQEKDNIDEYDEVVSPASKTNQYETMPAHQPDDQEHIYSKI